MLDKESLQMSIYDYLNYCKKNKKTKLVGVISDKQVVIYSQVRKSDYLTHEEISLKIENKIYKKEYTYQNYTYNKNNVHIFSPGDNDIIIDLPDTGNFTKSQYMFLNDQLNQIEKFNKENNLKVTLNIFSPNRKILDTVNITDIQAIKKELKNIINDEVVFQEEEIIGNTLSKDKIISNITNHIGLNRCNNIKDIISSLKKCKDYHNDSYYSKIFNELFPDYKETIEIISLFDKNEEINDLNFNNIKDKLNEIIINKKIKEIEEKLKQLEIIISESKQILERINIKKNIISNKEKLIELYNENLDTKELIDKEESIIEEIDRKTNIIKNNKELSTKRIDNNNKNTLSKLIYKSQNKKILKIITEYDKQISKLEEKKNALINGKEAIIAKENNIIKEFKNISGLSFIPDNFTDLKIDLSNSNEEETKKRLAKYIEIKESLEKELTTIQNNNKKDFLNRKK